MSKTRERAIEIIEKYKIRLAGCGEKGLIIEDRNKLEENAEDDSFFIIYNRAIYSTLYSLAEIRRQQVEPKLNKLVIKDFIKDLEGVRDADKRFKWFDLDELIKNFVSWACKGNGTQLISYDRYFYKNKITEEDVQSIIVQDIYWYKAKYYADLFSTDSPKKAKSVWLKLCAFQLLNRIKDKHFKFDEKVHIDKLIGFLKEYISGEGSK